MPVPALFHNYYKILLLICIYVRGMYTLYYTILLHIISRSILYFFCFLEILSLFILENFAEKCRLKALHIFNIYNKMYMYIAENA